MNKNRNILVEEREQILNFLRARYPLFHNSNFFFRDLQYGIRSYFDKRGIEISYPEAEKFAHEFSKSLEADQIFIRINNQGWKVNYPEFATAIPGDPFQF
ncbi:MAG: hypothetical protein KGZ85_14060 [Ignavibacterium sp.]|nr:hypothetical protein [Ignavibacterium sp.]